MAFTSYMIRGFCCALLTMMVLVGCSSVATKNKFYAPITAELRSGNVDSAVVLLENAREKNKFAEKDRLLYFIDAGLLNHYAGQYRTSNEKLHVAEEAAEELFTKSISRAALSLLLNDNVLEYAGEDYEILYTNLVKALNFLALDDFDGAFVEVRRANLKLELLEQKYARAAEELARGNPDDTDQVRLPYDVPHIRFFNDAFGRYLSMHIYAADGKFDDARIDYEALESAFELQPNIYDFPMPEVRYRADEGAILSVVGLVGLAPVKEAMNLRIRTDKDLNLVHVLHDSPDMPQAEYCFFPLRIDEDFYFKFAIPQLVPRPSIIAGARVMVDGELAGYLDLLEDVNRVAIETFEVKKALILVRSVARAVTKGLAAHQLKKEADTGGAEGWLKKLAIDIGVDLIENADLRCAQYLPGRIYVGDFEVDPGRHDILIEFLSFEGLVVGRMDITGYTVLDRGLNLIHAYSLD